MHVQLVEHIVGTVDGFDLDAERLLRNEQGLPIFFEIVPVKTHNGNAFAVRYLVSLEEPEEEDDDFEDIVHLAKGITGLDGDQARDWLEENGYG